MSAFLRLVPSWGWAALVALVLLGAQEVRVRSAQAATAAAVAAHAQDRAAWSTASAESAAAERETETLRRRAKDGVIDAARQENVRLAGAAADLRSVGGRLRDEVARLAAAADQGRGDPAAGTGGPTTAGAGLVLADLYRSADGEAIELAEAFDAARSAGLACERSYDSLTP